MRVIVWQVVVKQLAPAGAAAHEPVDIGIPLVIVPAQVRLLKVAIYVHESEKGGGSGGWILGSGVFVCKLFLTIFFHRYAVDRRTAFKSVFFFSPTQKNCQ